MGLYLEDRINIHDVFFGTLGVRQTHHDDFGDKTTWNASAMYVLPTNTKLKATAGTGFKAPSFEQLNVNYPVYGYIANPDLKPETSFGWDVGFEQSFWEERIVFGSTFFRNKIKNKIASPGFGLPLENMLEYRTWGIESFIQVALTDNLSLSANYTWTRVRDKENTNPGYLARRPLNEASVNVDWKFLCKGTLTAGVRYVGKRRDNWFDSNTFLSTPVKMPSYTVARIGAAWKFNDHVEVFGRVENICNRKYMDVMDYGTERIGFFGGITASF